MSASRSTSRSHKDRKPAHGAAATAAAAAVPAAAAAATAAAATAATAATATCRRSDHWQSMIYSLPVWPALALPLTI
eukprot:4777-Heterococcus_DN1.PRE.1